VSSYFVSEGKTKLMRKRKVKAIDCLQVSKKWKRTMK